MRLRGEWFDMKMKESSNKYNDTSVASECSKVG